MLEIRFALRLWVALGLSRVAKTEVISEVKQDTQAVVPASGRIGFPQRSSSKPERGEGGVHPAND